MRKLAFIVLVGVLFVCFAIFTTPVVVAQEDDNTPPSAPASLAGTVSVGSSATNYEEIRTTSITLTGTAEAGATIIVEKTTNGGVFWESMENVTVADDGTWSVDLTVDEGVVTGIRVKAVDVAGNPGSPTLFGYVQADASAPTVTITSPEGGATTNDTSITVTGTVTKDAWESYSDLTLIVQVGTASVAVPIASDGTFSTSVGLSVGTNTIIASVTDGINPASATSINVERATSSSLPTAAVSISVTIENIATHVGQVISVGENGITSVTVQNAQAVVVNFEEAQPVTTVSVTASAAVETVSVQAQEHTQMPSTVSNPTTALPGIVVSHYFEITITPTAATSVQVENAAIEFKVSKSWLATNNIISDSVVLLKYEGGQWVELPTTATGTEDATYKYYTATTTGFSTFAVAGKAASFDLMLILGISAFIVVAIVLGYVGFKRRGGEMAESKSETPPQTTEIGGS